MQVKLWGTRGSLPKATSTKELSSWVLPKTIAVPGAPISFGGATTCTEIKSNSSGLGIFVDAGSGFAYASPSVYLRGIKEVHLLQTHFHWDHIMGLPFFTPIYDSSFKVIVHHVHKSGEEDLKILFNGRNFPLTWDQLGAEVVFERHVLYQPFQIGEHTITAFALDHPGGSFGYRFKSTGESFAVGIDSEFKRHTAEQLGKDKIYYQDLGALTFDAQYSVDEIEHRYDWGHSTPHKGIDLAIEMGISNLIFSHHDLMRAETDLEKMFLDAQTYLQSKAGHKLTLHMGYDEMEFSLSNGGLKICNGLF